MRYVKAFCFIGIFAIALHAQDSKPNFTGRWQLDTAKSELHSGKISGVTLNIEQKGPSIHVVRTMTASDGKQTVTEFNCTTDGKECDAKGTKVSLWYNGDALVEMDIGETVTKLRYELAPDGKSIDCQLSFITPPADGDKLLFDKL